MGQFHCGSKGRRRSGHEWATSVRGSGRLGNPQGLETHAFRCNASFCKKSWNDTIPLLKPNNLTMASNGFLAGENGCRNHQQNHHPHVPIYLQGMLINRTRLSAESTAGSTLCSEVRRLGRCASHGVPRVPLSFTSAEELVG